MGQWGFEKKDIQINDDYTEMKVGNDIVLQVFVEEGSLQCRWNDTWAAWDDLQNSPEVHEFGKRAAKTLSHMGKGTGKKQREKGGNRLLGTSPSGSSVTMPVRKHQFFQLGCE